MLYGPQLETNNLSLYNFQLHVCEWVIFWSFNLLHTII